jgi:hypothetical protein
VSLVRRAIALARRVLRGLVHLVAETIRDAATRAETVEIDQAALRHATMSDAVSSAPMALWMALAARESEEKGEESGEDAAY